ncbi:hypothetical protein PQX77_006798 [Marasmius sp. AFHP31]|nr:hypothetical protein PQX77_006798 [Marasmius sp. AFHP31]
MGESGWAGGVPGSGDVVKRGWEERMSNVVNGTENLRIGFYGFDSSCAILKEGRVEVEMSAASGEGHVRFTHEDFQRSKFLTPYIFIPVTHQSTLFHAGDTIDHEYFLNGTVSLDAYMRQTLADPTTRYMIRYTNIHPENTNNVKGVFCARWRPRLRPPRMA